MDTSRVIIHSDMNAFYASVEQAEHPELRGKPVIVGGDEQARHGIVLTASYEAKRRGVKTAMALWEARRACPDALVVLPHFDLYQRYSHLAREIYYNYTDLVEPFGPDEAWLDITHSVALAGGDPILVAQEISERIRTELGLSVSVGLSWNKIFAKFGSDHDKPDGFMVITPHNAQKLVWTQPVKELLYVGPATSRKLNALGIRTIGELACADPELIRRYLGKMGTMVQIFAQGRDESPVRAYEGSLFDVEREVKSVGNGVTCPFDIEDETCARQVIWLLGESVAQRLRALNLKARCVSITGRDFKTLTFRSRQRQLERPSNITSEICSCATELLLSDWDFRYEKLRGIGMRASSVSPALGPVQLDIEGVEQKRLERLALDHAIDDLRVRFGNHAVRRLSELSNDKLALLDPERDHIVHPVSYFA
ncbi:MAG: DNA polymerase IV [Atopobiaceae bacterium]|jgi:DNA polymerase-4